MRLLYNMVSRIFFSKIDRFDWVTKKDIAFMYYLIMGQPINLLFFILAQAKEANRKSKICLPYDMVFTLIFQEFGVDYTEEDARRLLYIDRYNERSFHQIRYHKVDDRWIHNSLCI